MNPLKKIILLSTLMLSTQAYATMYENAEDESSSRWQVYDNTPAGATIDNVYSSQRDNNAIEFIGAGTSNGYMLGNLEKRKGAWNNTKEHTLQWKMNFTKGVVVYVRVMTQQGARYLYYTNSSKSYGKRNSTYIHIGLGKKASDGNWHTFTRDLEADLKKYEPNNRLIAVNAFLVRGNGFVDDVELVAEDGENRIIHGGKQDKQGEGSYYKWDDSESIRGLIFDAYQDFTLKSVKVYNQKGQESTRIFTLYDANGVVVDSKSIYVKAGVQRVSLNMHVPKGKGYKLMADIHKGLYKNNHVTGYPYTIGNVGAITGSDIDKSHYYFFYDWEVGIDNSNPTPPNPNPTPTSKAYIPKLDFNSNDVYHNQKVIHVSNTDELKNALIGATPKSTILLNDGTYDDLYVQIPGGKHDITIKALHKGKVTIVPHGFDDGSAIIFSRATTKNEEIHHINFVGINVSGEGESGLKQFIKSEGGATYSVHHIYFRDMEMHHLGMGLYSGLHSHDWTIDHCYMHDSDISHMWYMMGWHQAVINSTFDNGSHDIIAIRGYYPDGEKHTYIGDKDDHSCHGNVLTETRENRRGFLPKNEWTHIIKNNHFNAWKRSDNQRWKSNNHIGIGYGLYGDPYCGAERVYLPPQNIEISNNTFSNKNENSELLTSAIVVDAWRDIESNSLATIHNIVIKENTFIAPKEYELPFIKAGDNSGDITPDISKIHTSNNRIKQGD